MAEKDNKVPENVDGPYYVDDSCIACEMCVGDAPENFEMTEEHAYVKKQPETDEEEEQCEEALYNCPVDAIGDDG